MSRRGTPPDGNAPGAFAGLTQRRRERDLPVGTEKACENGCGRAAAEHGAYCCDTCAVNPGHHSVGNCPKALR